LADAVYQSIRKRHVLPTPEGIALQILHVARDENATLDEMVALVESDPSTAARILQYVNAPVAGVSRHIASLPAAVVVLGMQTVAQLVLGFSLLSNHRKSNCDTFDYESFWAESVARATACRHIAYALGAPDRDEAFTCGLLSQIGRLALATAYPHAYDQLLRTCDDSDPIGLAEAERDAFGIDHLQMGAEMLEDWGLPKACCEAVRHQRVPIRPPVRDAEPEGVALARACRFADWLTLLMFSRAPKRESLSRVSAEFRAVGIGPNAFGQVFDSIVDELRQAARLFNVQARLVPSLAELSTRAGAP